MESAFAWLGYIAEWLGNFIPRIKIVRSTHAGVRFKHGKDAQEMKPGIHVYWPIVTEIEVMPVARQTHNLPSQSLMTKDGKPVVVSGVVVYEIKDIVAAMSRNWDISDTINDITLIAMAEVITSHDLDFLRTNLSVVQKKLTSVTRKKLKPFGVRVFRAALTDFSICRAINLINGGSASKRYM